MFLDLYLADQITHIFICGWHNIFHFIHVSFRNSYSFYCHLYKTLCYRDFSYACYHYRKIFAFVFRPVCKRGAPLRTAVGMLFATGHSSFLRSTKMALSTRKHGLTCLEYMVRIVNQTARIAMKSC